MAKKKKEPPIAGTGRKPDELLVQKSRPLFALWQSDLTLQEFKILDTYLSRINSHYPDKRVVLFEKGELENLLGVSKINHPQLKERLKHLMGNVVEVGNPKNPKSMHLITLFEEASAEQDEETGLWEVRLECTQKAMKYFFNIEKLGYLRYRLRGIVRLQSRYSYILFLYLESQRKFKTWTVELDELKSILKCDTEETYKEFKRFNDLILKRCSKEIFEKTECRFTYDPVKKGRKVVAIKFTLETIPDLADELPDQLSMDDLPTENLSPAEQHRWETLQMYRKALPDGLTDEEIWILETMAETKAPPSPHGLEVAITNYFHLKTLYFKRSNKKDPIKHPFAWLQKAIEND